MDGIRRDYPAAKSCCNGCYSVDLEFNNIKKITIQMEEGFRYTRNTESALSNFAVLIELSKPGEVRKAVRYT